MMSTAADLGFIHRFVPGDASRAPLLLLHGTGGNEDDLLPLGQRLAPGTALLSPRGKVLEHGMPRFFHRLAEGVFDVEDMRKRAEELAQFVAEARKEYDLSAPIAVGYSNGANIAYAMMLAKPGVLAGAVLLRAMLPFVPPPPPNLAGVPVLILTGARDPLAPPGMRGRLPKFLTRAGANVTEQVVNAGHELTGEDLAVAAQWLAARS